MAKKGKKSHRRFAIPVLTVGALALPAALANQNTGTITDKALQWQSYYTGFDSTGKFDAANLAVGYGPLAVLWILKKVGITRSANAALARFNLPISVG